MSLLAAMPLGFANRSSPSRRLAAATAEQIPPKTLPPIAPGLLAATAVQPKVDRTLVAAMVAENRRQGLRGEVFFY